MSKKNLLTGLVGAVGLISGLTLASRVMGFFRWFTQSAWVGTGAFANAYATANQIPNVLFEVIAGGALTGVTIPLLALPLAKKLHNDVSRIASALLTWTLIILVPIGAIVFFGAGALAQLLPSPQNVDHAVQVALLTTFLKVFAIQIPLYGMCVVLTGVLQAHHKFFWPAFGPLLNSVVVIATYALFGYMNAGNTDPGQVTRMAQLCLAWGTTAGVAAMALPMIIPVTRLGVRLRPTVSLEKELAGRALRLGGSGMVALLAQQMSVVAVVFVARAYGGPGTLPIYQYAQAVYMLPYAVLAYPVATAMFPRMATAIKSGDTQGFQRQCAASLRVLMLIACVSAALLVAEAYPAYSVFSLVNPVPGMWQGLVAMSPGLIGYIVIYHGQRALYALDRGGASMVGASAGWVAVLGASIGFAHLLAPHGAASVGTMVALGLANSVGMWLAGILLIAALRRHAGPQAIAGVWKLAAMGIVLAAVVGAAGLWVSMQTVALLGRGVVGALGSALAALVVVAVLAGPAALVVIRKEKARANS